MSRSLAEGLYSDIDSRLSHPQMPTCADDVATSTSRASELAQAKNQLKSNARPMSAANLISRAKHVLAAFTTSSVGGISIRAKDLPRENSPEASSSLHVPMGEYFLHEPIPEKCLSGKVSFRTYSARNKELPAVASSSNSYLCGEMACSDTWPVGDADRYLETPIMG